MARTLRVGTALGAAVLLYGASATACEADTECKGERVCVSGECVAATAPPAPEPLPPPPPPPPAPVVVTPPAVVPVLQPYVPPPPLERPTERNVGMIVAGSVFTGVGVLALPWAIIFAEDAAAKDEFDDETSRGATVLAGGAIAFITMGVPLLIFGTLKHPVEVAVSPTRMDLSWRF